MDNRKYTLKRWGSRVFMDTITSPPYRKVISKGKLSVLISKNNKSVVQIARYMRIRPEAVFQLLSDAFDESLMNHAATVKDGCIHFDCDVATITLDPGEDGHHWELLYKAKEAMFNKDISPHSDDAYSIPETLYDGNVKLSFTRITPMMQLIYGSEKKPSLGTFDVLNHRYSDALREKKIIRDGNTLTFSSGFRSQSGKDIYVTIEPDYYDPLPNVWHITRIEEL